MIARLFLILVLGLSFTLGAGGAEAQSLFSTRGLGYPIEPLDARSRGLGGVALGLASGELMWTNPGGLIGLPAPAFVGSYQHDSFSNNPTEEFSGETARFPVMLLAFPFGEQFVVYGGYSAYLDQNWQILAPDTLPLAGEDVPVVDQVSSEGGISRLRIGGSYALLSNLGIGLALDGYTGSVDRTRGRAFPGEAGPACCRSNWEYGGLGFSGGVHWAATPAVTGSISFTYGGQLDATQVVDSVEVVSTYDLPLSVDAGASARISQNLLLAVGAGWDGWSTLDGSFADGSQVRDSWSLNGGIEWDAITIRTRPVPIRIGARTSALPFQTEVNTGDSWATERALTGGLGVLLAGGSVRTDMAVEMGNRGYELSPIDESFWRLSFSVRVLGR